MVHHVAGYVTCNKKLNETCMYHTAAVRGSDSTEFSAIEGVAIC
jgi:hypothetical protein